MANFIEMLKDDLNQEDGIVISWFTRITTFLFKSVLFIAIPLFIYLFWSIF
ncbi:hypothetical protein [Pseudoneobacillus sp. C159]